MTLVERRSLNQINQLILNLESDLRLLDQKVEGVYYWERVRHPVHKKIIRKAQKRGNESPNDSQRRSQSTRVRKYAKKTTEACKNIFEKNPYQSSPSDIVFYGKGRRRQLDDGTWYDIHLDPIAEAIDESCTFIEPSGGPPQAASEDRRFLTLPKFISDVAQKIGYVYKLPKSERERLKKFESVIENKLNINIDVVSRVESELSNRQTRLPLYEKVIERINPKICFLTYGHSHHSTFIEACHRNAVTTVDVQYCALDPNYWPYHYPGSRQRQVKPDYILLWGDFWKQAADLPFDNDEMFVGGFPHFERQLRNYDEIEKKEQIIFISNKKSGPELSKVAAELADSNIDKEIVYKLHGQEFDTWQSDYPELAKASNNEKLTIIDEMEGSLHRLLATSQVQVGVSSTALYEGLGFGLPTYIVEAPYAYEMERLIDAGHARLVEGAEELKSNLRSNPPKVSSTEFFKKNSEKQLNQVLSQILPS